MGQLGTKRDKKTFPLKIAGALPGISGVTKPDKMVNKTRHCPDISGQNPDKIPSLHAQMSGIVCFCPVFSVFPPPIPTSGGLGDESLNVAPAPENQKTLFWSPPFLSRGITLAYTGQL